MLSWRNVSTYANDDAKKENVTYAGFYSSNESLFGRMLHFTTKRCCRKINKKYLISYKNNLKQRWDIFVIILAIQNCVFVPLRISFDFNAVLFDTILFQIVDYTIDMCFLVDIILMFFTTY